jgi:hypothetical protein
MSQTKEHLSYKTVSRKERKHSEDLGVNEGIY